MRKALAGIAAILLLSLASIAAAAPAATATSAQASLQSAFGAPCQLSSMSSQEQNDWFKSIFGYLAEEVNGLSQNALKANTPGQVQQVNVYPSGTQTYVLRDIAGLVNMDPIQLASEYGIYPNRPLTTPEANQLGKPPGTVLTQDDVLNYQLSRAQVLMISTRHADKATSINRLLGISAGVEKQAMPYENLKVRLPGEQKDVPLSQILDRPEINSSDCFVSSSDIKGRLEFVSILDSNLRVGAAGYSASQAAGQHISYSRATASISPYDNSMVVPAQFERYVIGLGNWASWDMYVTLLETSVIFTDMATIKATQQSKAVQLERDASRITLLGKETFQDTHAIDQLVPVNPGGVLVLPVDPSDASKFLSTPVAVNAQQFKAGFLEGTIALPSTAGAPSSITYEEFKRVIQSEFQLPPGAPASLQNDVNNALKAALSTKVDDELKLLPYQEKQLKDLAQKVQQRTITTFGFGLAWLGPARFALDLANSLLLESTTANRDQYFDLYINNKDYLSAFRKNTDFLGTGGITDFASDMLGGQGVPTKAFSTNPVYLITNPLVDRDAVSTSTTGFRQEAGRWSINFNWVEGGNNRAESILFEDIRTTTDYTSMAFSSKNQRISTNAAREKFSDDVYRGLELAAPVFNMLLYRTSSLPASASGLLQLALYNFIVAKFIDPDTITPGEKCDPDLVDSYLRWYKAAVVLGHAEVLVPVSGLPALSSKPLVLLEEYAGKLATSGVQKVVAAVGSVSPKTGAFLSTSGGLLPKFIKAVAIVDPIQMFKQIEASRGQRYVSTCKDDAYKVVAWQKLSANNKPGGSLTQTLQTTGIDKLTQGLNLGSALSGLGQKVQQTQMGDVLSFRATYYDGMGSLNAAKLIYLHLDGGSMQWHSVYAQAGACFRSNMQSKDGSTVFTVDSNGVKKTVNGTTVASFSGQDWKDRGLFSQRLPGYAMTLVPNKIITTQLACGSSPAMQVDSKGALTASSECAATQCLAAGILQSSGETDFSRAVGTVTRIEAEKGTFTIANGYIYYSPASGSGANTEQRIPSVEAEDAGKREGGFITVTGKGDVVASGYVTGSQGEIDAGALHSIIADKARIEFEPSTGLLRAAVYSMASILGNNVLGMTTRPATNVGANNRSVPAIRIDAVGAKAGSEEAAAAFNKALSQIQGATGGLQMLETADNTYFFTTDANGNPILRIFNKKTGQTRDLPITGPVTKDANGNIVVPTREGPVQFKMDMQDGKPIINVNGPGIAELATLLAARGPNGLLAYNPATGQWEVFNGQDIPWNRDFAKNGLSVFGGADGSKGVSQASIFAPPAGVGLGAGTNALAAMPSWPEGLAFAAMLGAIVGGVALVRLRH